MISIKGLLSEKREQRDFLKDYLDTLSSFEFNVKTYQSCKDDLCIQNTDLWIECYIELFPELQEFRDLVKNEMMRLGIERHPDYVYQKENNHYYYSNKRTIDQLKLSL